MNVVIHSLSGTVFQDEAESVTVRTTTGEITILDHHRPLITALASCEARIRQGSGEIVSVPITSGFLEVGEKNFIRMLINS